MLSWAVFFYVTGGAWAGYSALPRKSKEQVEADTQELERLRRTSPTEYRRIKNVRAAERLFCDHPGFGWPLALALLVVGTLLVALSFIFD
jgi:hypothetical protein